MNSSNKPVHPTIRKRLLSRLRRIPLRSRLALLVLLTAIPILFLATGVIINRAGSVIHDQAQAQLQTTVSGLAASTQAWYVANLQTLDELVSLPDIISMDAAKQKPILVTISATHPQLFLVHTTDTSGMNVARNDDQELRDYSDRQWYQGAAAGAPDSQQVLISRTTGQPSLNMAAPIRDKASNIIGVGSLVSALTDISNQIAVNKIGQTGYTYVLDPAGKVIAHPDPAYTSDLRDLSTYPPVAYLLQNTAGEAEFTDQQGTAWRAYGETLPNGWIVIAQQQVAEQNRPVNAFRVIAEASTVFGAVLIFVLVQFILRRSLQPVTDLTETARAISAGDLTRRAAVESEDEIGELALAFNRMTEQIRASIASLERRVAERTRALETSAGVSRHLSTILDPQQLTVAIVDELQRAFNYYHVHVYLWDDDRQNLLMAGGTGEIGQELLRRGHKVPGGRGLVGRAAKTNRPVFVTDTHADPGWLPNPLLPDTRCEAAVPIAVAEQVLGVLDVQQNVVDGLNEQDIDLLMAVANQVAVALQNAEQYTRTRSALAEAELFRRITNISAQGLGIATIDGNAFYANPALADMLGIRDPQEAIGRPLPEFYPPEYQRRLVDTVMPAVMQQGRWSGETILQSPDGAQKPVLENVFVITDENGAPQYVVNAVTDLTERLRTQQAFARQAEELSKVVEISTQVTQLLDPQDILQQVADLVKASFGFYHVHIYLLAESGDMLHLAAGAGEVGKQMLAQGWRIALDSEHSLVARSARQRHGAIANDVYAEADFLPNPLLPDTASEMAVPLLIGDQMLGVLDVQSDQVGRFAVTDIAIQTTLASQVAVVLQNARQYQQTLQSEQLTRTIIDATPDWIFIKDRQHRYRLVNKGYADSLHMQPEDMLGKNDLELGFPEEVVLGDPRRGIVGFWTDDDAVMSSGQVKVVPSEPAVIEGRQLYLSTIKVPLKDESAQAWGVLGFVRDITEREKLRQETEERLTEIDALYRAMNRQAWKDFVQSAESQQAFIFDRNTVLPAGEQWLAEVQQTIQRNSLLRIAPSDQLPLVAAPLALRGQPIGALLVEDDPQRPLTPDDLSLLAEMSDQIALALESARLFTQTQSALATTESLYTASAEVVRAATPDHVLRAVVESTALKQFTRCSILLFDRPWVDQEPEGAYLVAQWNVDNAPGILPTGHFFDFSVFHSAKIIGNQRSMIISDVSQDTRLDQHTRALLERMGNAVCFFPLLTGGQCIGWLTATAPDTLQLTEEQERQINSLVGQAATVVQGIRLLGQSQSRARYEQVLREITARVRGSTDPDAVLRTAVQEVGALLGRSVLIRLSGASQ